MVISATIRAAMRLSLRMAFYQFKRLMRNFFVPVFHTAYTAHLLRGASKLGNKFNTSALSLDLAEYVGAYYAADTAEMDAASRGQFTFFGKKVDFGSIPKINWMHKLDEENDHHLWRMKLTQLEVVHSLLASCEYSRHKTAVELIQCASRSASLKDSEAFKAFWAPYGASHRLLAIGTGLALAERRGYVDPEIRVAIHNFMAMDAAFVWSNIEFDLNNNHTERNLAALCLFHTISNAPSKLRRRKLDRAIAKLICDTVLDDGMQAERSAMYQGLTCMSLRVFAGTPFLSDSTRKFATMRSSAAEDAWLFLTHDDGEIALFNDAWIEEVPSAHKLIENNRPVLKALPSGGYYGVASGNLQLWFDAGPIGPSWNPGHGHADFLSIEVDLSGHRLIVDPGTSQYSTGAQRSWERSSASHNGPRLEGIEPVEYSGCFKVGRLAKAQSISKRVLRDLPAGTVGGTLNANGACMARLIIPLPCGGIVVVDNWSISTPDGSVSLIIPGTWRIEKSPRSILVQLADVRGYLHCLLGSISSATPATWTRRFMEPEPASLVVISPAQQGQRQCSAFIISQDSSPSVSRELLQKAYRILESA